MVYWFVGLLVCWFVGLLVCWVFFFSFSELSSTDQEEHVFNEDDDNLINMLGNSDTETLMAGLANGSASQASLVQLMTMLKNGTAGSGGAGVGGNVGGEAGEKMENALKDQQEKFTMMQAKMKALDGETSGGGGGGWLVGCGWLW